MFDSLAKALGLRAIDPVSEFRPEAAEPDGLDQTITDIAQELMGGQAGEEYRKTFVRLFKNDPRFFENVSPEIRDKFRQFIAEQSA